MRATSASTATRAKWERMQTLEVPCSVCEFQGVLHYFAKVMKGDVLKYVLERLPGAPADMHNMRKRIAGETWQQRDVYTGKDEMRATAVARRWIKDGPTFADSAWQRYVDNGVSLQLPVLWCRRCGRLLKTKLRVKKQGGPIQMHCAKGMGCAVAWPLFVLVMFIVSL